MRITANLKLLPKKSQISIDKFTESKENWENSMTLEEDFAQNRNVITEISYQIS